MFEIIPSVLLKILRIHIKDTLLQKFVVQHNRENLKAIRDEQTSDIAPYKSTMKRKNEKGLIYENMILLDVNTGFNANEFSNFKKKLI